MTKSEVVYVTNEIVEKLNEPYSRGLAVGIGKDQAVQEISEGIISENYPNIGVKSAAKIIQAVQKKATSCAYPKEEIPRACVRLNLAEVLFLTDINKGDLLKAKETLHRLIDVMSDNDDDRAQSIASATQAINEILLSSYERRGENI